MPNIKSAKKRVIVNNKKTEQNKNIRSEVKSEIKKIEALISENKIEEAKAILPNVFKLIDSAESKNIFHKNNASNKKAKISKKISDAEKKAGVEVKAEIKPAKKVEPVEEKTEEVKPARKPRAKKTADAE